MRINNCYGGKATYGKDFSFGNRKERKYPTTPRTSGVKSTKEERKMNNRDYYFDKVKKSVSNSLLAHFIAATSHYCDKALCGYKEHGCGDCIFVLGREKEIKKWLKSEYVDGFKGSAFDERIFPTKKSTKKKNKKS